MSQVSFDQRVTSLAQKHRQMELGITYKVEPDGLITAHPHQRLVPRFPVGPLVAVLAIALVLKAGLIVAIGEAAYAEKVALFRSGSMAERAAAWTMQPEPASRALVIAIRALEP